jgi:hypothetical protein
MGEHQATDLLLNAIHGVNQFIDGLLEHRNVGLHLVGKVVEPDPALVQSSSNLLHLLGLLLCHGLSSPRNLTSP